MRISNSVNMEIPSFHLAQRSSTILFQVHRASAPEWYRWMHYFWDLPCRLVGLQIPIRISVVQIGPFFSPRQWHLVERCGWVTAFITHIVTRPPAFFYRFFSVLFVALLLLLLPMCVARIQRRRLCGRRRLLFIIKTLNIWFGQRSHMTYWLSHRNQITSVGNSRSSVVLPSFDPLFERTAGLPDIRKWSTSIVKKKLHYSNRSV